MTAPIASSRPPLDLGPMTGPPEYILARCEALTRAYAGLLDVEKIDLVDSPRGSTNCSTTINVPLSHPEGYLVLEHELSHWLFGTDVVLASRYVAMLVERLLANAGIRLGSDAALPYEKHLREIIHHLWNVIEDWRCCWLWTQLYRGGGELLQQRWRDIVTFETPDEVAKKNLVVCLSCYAAGKDVQGVPQDFEDCKPAMRRALNLVAGVDHLACLAITGRLVKEIAEALLDNNPPPPPSATAPVGSQRGPRKPEEGLHVLKQLCATVPRLGPHADTGAYLQGGLGGDDVRPSDKPRGGDGSLAKIQQLAQADDRESGEGGDTPFQVLLSNGAEAMEERLEAARRASLRRVDTPDESNIRVILGWSQEAGIPILHVQPTRELPPPTPVAEENRRILEQLRMKKRTKRDHEGEFMADAFLSALGAGELDRPFYERVVRVPRFELLFLFDVSGSMTIGQALPLTERAIADSAHAVFAIRSKVSMWGFSDSLYMFDRVGSPLSAEKIAYGSTCMVQALDVAHRWGKRSPQTRAIMLVTDGWPTSCRHKNSTGNPIQDLRAVLDEVRADKIPLTVLGIRHAGHTVDAAREMYDRAFGVGGYGMVATFDEVAVELPRAVRIMAAAHINKGVRRS